MKELLLSEALTIYDALVQAQRDGKPAALATVIRTQGSVPRREGSKMLVWADGSIVGTVGGGQMESLVVQEGLKIMQSGKPATFTYNLTDIQQGDPGICGGTAEIFVEPIGLTPTVVVIGCGHVGKALAELAKWSGFRVIVSDDRVELCSEANIPNMDAYYPIPAETLMEQLEITPLTYIAAVTRGLPVDVKFLPHLLESDVPYIGLIGSKRRWAITEKALREEYNVSEEAIKRVQAPIGFDIKAETPQEIAVSIMAEIIQRYRG